MLVALDTAGNVVLILFPTCNISIKQHAVSDYTQLTLGDFFYGIYLAGPWGNGTDIIGEIHTRYTQDQFIFRPFFN